MFVACSGDGARGVGQPSGNAVVYSGSSYPLAQGLADVRNDTTYHSNVDFTIIDGYFTSFTDTTNGFPVVKWLANESQVELDLELYSPGGGFLPGTFGYTPLTADDPSLIGASFFNASYAGFDTNGDDEVSEAEEIDVVGGSVTVSGSAPNYQLAFNLQLANGLFATGSYAGEFIVDD